jgi:hypothetical protein
MLFASAVVRMAVALASARTLDVRISLSISSDLTLVVPFISSMALV